MSLSKSMLAEMQHEAANTRKLLEIVPLEKADFKPHEKSMTLGRLATHIAEITGWWKETLTQDVLDFANMDYKPRELKTTEELLALHDDLVTKATLILSEINDEEFGKMWTMRNGEHIYFTMPKGAVARSWCMNHLYHHRGQLTVYLRLLNVKLPGIYGPTADDQTM